MVKISVDNYVEFFVIDISKKSMLVLEKIHRKIKWLDDMNSNKWKIRVIFLVHTQKISSRYNNESKKLTFAFQKIFFPSPVIKNFTYRGANFVHVAISSFWCNVSVPVLKKISVKTIQARYQRELEEIDWSSLK